MDLFRCHFNALRAAVLAAVFCLMPGSVVSQTDADVSEFVGRMVAADGEGFACRWSVVGPGGPVAADGSTAFEAVIASGIAPVRFAKDNVYNYLEVEDFLGEVDARFKAGSGDCFDPEQLDFTNTEGLLNVFFYRLSNKKKNPSNPSNPVTVAVNNAPFVGYYVAGSLLATERVCNVADDGHLSVEISQSPGAVLAFGNEYADILSTNSNPDGKFVFFTKLRFEFYEIPRLSTGTPYSAVRSISPFEADDRYYVDATFDEPCEAVYIDNLYGIGLEYHAPVFNLAADGYAPFQADPFRVNLLSDGTATIVTDHEVMMRPDYYKGGRIATNNRQLKFNAPGTNFSINGYIIVNDDEVPTQLVNASETAVRSPLALDFRDRLINGQLTPLRGTWKLVANTGASTSEPAVNPHWIRNNTSDSEAGDCSLELYFGKHTLLPVTITHDGSVSASELSLTMDKIWHVGSPIDIVDVSTTIPVDADIATRLGGAPAGPVTFDLTEYGDNAERVGINSTSRVISIYGTLGLPGEHGALYICRGRITDYEAATLADTDKGHQYGTVLYDTHSAVDKTPSTKAEASTSATTSAAGATTHNIQAHLNLQNLPTDPENPDNQVFTLYASYDDPTSPTLPRKFVALTTLDSNNPTTGVTDITTDADTPAGALPYKLDGHTLTATTVTITILTPAGQTVAALAPSASASLPAGIYLIRTATTAHLVKI